MDQRNRRISELEKWLRNSVRAFRERVAADTRYRMNIERVFAVSNDTDEDAAPDALVGARLRPRQPLGGSAIALPEPDEDLTAEAIAGLRR
jgi:hypothetical protein